MIKDRIQSKGRAFTLVEMMVVIVVLGILAALLMPVLSRAKEQARSATCMSNLRQIGLAMVVYANDFNDQLVPLNSGGPWRDPVTPHNPTNWWYRILSNGGYLPHIDQENKVWTCPNALKDQAVTSNQWAWGTSPRGYGPAENTNHVRGLTSIIFWAKESDGSRRGSARLTEIQRQSQLWLMGDVGVPIDEELDIRKYQYGGYYRMDIASVAFPPNELGIYDRPTPKQPAVRHGLRANVCFVDGHVESWRYRNLAFNTNDVWGIDSR